MIADWHGDVDDPAALAARLDSVPGVVAHGLFGPELTSDIIVAANGHVVPGQSGTTL